MRGVLVSGVWVGGVACASGLSHSHWVMVQVLSVCVWFLLQAWLSRSSSTRQSSTCPEPLAECATGAQAAARKHAVTHAAEESVEGGMHAGTWS